jgi:hypothetical protein
MLVLSGIIDAEFGARGLDGISLYLTLPIAFNQKLSVLTIIYILATYIFAKYNSRMKSWALLLVLILLSGICLSLFQLGSQRAFKEEHTKTTKQNTISSSNDEARTADDQHNSTSAQKITIPSSIDEPHAVNDAPPPCNRDPRLTVPEFLSRYNCKREKYIEKAMDLLESCPYRPVVNKTTIERLLDLNPEQGLPPTYTAHIQIIDGQIFIGPNPSLERFFVDAIVHEILSVLRECQLPDSEFVIKLSDGFDYNFWPVATPEGDLYFPVFAQEKHKSKGLPLSILNHVSWPV